MQGFFSVQVMDRALDVWGLKYVYIMAAELLSLKLTCIQSR